MHVIKLLSVKPSTAMVQHWLHFCHINGCKSNGKFECAMKPGEQEGMADIAIDSTRHGLTKVLNNASLGLRRSIPGQMSGRQNTFDLRTALSC